MKSRISTKCLLYKKTKGQTFTSFETPGSEAIETFLLMILHAQTTLEISNFIQNVQNDKNHSRSRS